MLISNRARASALPSGNRDLLMIVVLIVAVLVVGYGLLHLFHGRSGPQAAVAEFLETWKARDYEKLYEALDIPPQLAMLVPNAASLQKLTQGADAVDTYTISDSTEKGDTATVKATVVAPGGKATTLDLTLRRVEGKWKVDLGTLVVQEMRQHGGSAPAAGMGGFGGVIQGLGGGVPGK